MTTEQERGDGDEADAGEERAVGGGADRPAAASGWLGAAGRALEGLVGSLNPWPGYAKTAEELADMLRAELPEAGQRRPAARLDELLERHRHYLAGRPRGLASGEWRV